MAAAGRGPVTDVVDGPVDAPPAPLAVVVTASDRAAAGQYDDVSGPVLVAGLRALGLHCEDPVVVPDGLPVQHALRRAVGAGAALVVTTGGTGLGPRDMTPEATLEVLDRVVPGIAEALRADAVRRGVPAGVLSRGVAGTIGRTLVVNVAGSTGAARDALEVLADVLPHALSQLAGGDHAG